MIAAYETFFTDVGMTIRREDCKDLVFTLNYGNREPFEVFELIKCGMIAFCQICDLSKEDFSHLLDEIKDHYEAFQQVHTAEDILGDITGGSL